MLKKYPIIKWFIIVFVSFIVIIFAFGFWFMSLLPSEENKTTISHTQARDLPYLSEYTNAKRGKILAVVTSCDKMGNSQKKTGYELTELSRTYYVFEANGFEVDIASPKGGKPSVIIDGDDMGAFDYAFLNDSTAQNKTANTIPLDKVVSENYKAIFFVGGKGAMFDFPQNTTIQSIVKEYYETGKVVGAVCHGPAALINVTLNNGKSLLENKKVSGFTNEEELFLIPNAKEIFPFLLEDALTAKGAQVNKGSLYLGKVSQDGNLVTGQNPWSTWNLAETMVKQLGYTPIKRTSTAEENTIRILSIYKSQGYSEAKNNIYTMLADKGKPIERNLLAIHSLISAMQWDLGSSFDLIRLLAYAKKCAK